MDIYVLVGSKTEYWLKIVEAKEVKWKGEFRFFSHPSIKNPNKISFTEYSTGRCVYECEPTKGYEKKFIEMLNKNDVFLGKIRKVISKLPKIYHNK